MSTVHVEIPAGSGPLLEVPASAVPTVTDEMNLIANWGPVPGLPGLTLVVFTADGTGTPVHAEIPADASTVLLEVPPGAQVPLADEDDLLVLAVPGAVLALLKVA